MTDFILCTTEDGRSQVKLRAKAIQANQQDEAELTALETKIKRRPK